MGRDSQLQGPSPVEIAHAATAREVTAREVTASPGPRPLTLLTRPCRLSSPTGPTAAETPPGPAAALLGTRCPELAHRIAIHCTQIRRTKRQGTGLGTQPLRCQSTPRRCPTQSSGRRQRPVGHVPWPSHPPWAPALESCGPGVARAGTGGVTQGHGVTEGCEPPPPAPPPPCPGPRAGSASGLASPPLHGWCRAELQPEP